MTDWLSLAAGGAVGCGAFLVAMGLRKAERRGMRATMETTRESGRGRLMAQAGMGVLVTLVVLLLTGWPVGAVLSAGVALSLPSVFGGKREREAEIAKVEAIAGWAGQLRDLLMGGNGLLDAIEASAPFAPGPIRLAVGRLAVGMRRGRLVTALRAFAAEVDDPMADLVVASLVVATTEQAGRLSELLSTLASRTMEQAAARMRIDRDRASIRTQVRGVVLVTVACVVGLLTFDRDLLAAYDSAGGQVVLAGIGACFLSGFALLARMSKPHQAEGFVLAMDEMAR